MAATRSITQARTPRSPFDMVMESIYRSGVSYAEIKVDGPSGKAFKSLSPELHQLILESLEDDDDILAYSRICKASCAAVTTSVWRKRFIQKFDCCDGETKESIFKKYKYRQIVSDQMTFFSLKGHLGRVSRETRERQLFNQKNWLKLLRALILESDARRVVDTKGRETIQGKNINFIRDTLSPAGKGRYIDIIDSVFRIESRFKVENIVSAHKEGALLFVVQLILTPISLHPDLCNDSVWHFNTSQTQVYATPAAQPIFIGKFRQNINVMWLLNVVNFFKFHFKDYPEGILRFEYQDLPHYQYPQVWIGRIKDGSQSLGTFWKGCHTYMDEHELFRLRNSQRQEGDVFSDSLDLGDSFLDIEIFFDEKNFPSNVWPATLESFIPSDPFGSSSPSPGCRRSKRKIPGVPAAPETLNFYGVCRGDKTSYFYGRIHSIPHQNGVYGFQRIVFLMFYHPELGHIDGQASYIYEGCVLPGSCCIVGRWWDVHGDPKDNATMSGPFIWWNVARGVIDDSFDRNELVSFLQNNIP